MLRKEGAVVTCEVYEVIPQLKSGGTSRARTRHLPAEQG